MSNIAMQGGATGTGTVTLLAPVTNTNRTINLPDSNGTILTTATGKLPVQIVTAQFGSVATGTTLIPFDDTIPQNTEGNEYMTLAITPTNVNSTLEIDVLWNGGCNIANYMATALFQDSTASALSTSWATCPGINYPMFISLKHLMTAGTLSATTFKVRVGGIAANTTTFNGFGGTRYFGGVMASRITIKEYLP
jgi:hypothetical protein